MRCSRRRARRARTRCPVPSSIRRRSRAHPRLQRAGRAAGVDVGHEQVYFLTGGSKLPFPMIPPPLRNHGNYIISHQRVRALARRAGRGRGRRPLQRLRRTGCPDGRTPASLGVRTGDRGVGKHGEQKSSFEPGVDITAKVTIFCDGVRGNLTKQLLRRLELGRGPASPSSSRSA